MNILYHFRTRGTGAEGVHVAGMVKAFRQQGHQVVLSSPTGIDPCASAGADPFALAGKRGFWAWISRYSPGFVFELLEIGYNLSALLRNRRLLRAGHFDMIYERHAFFLFSTAWLAQRREIPLIVEVNELAGDPRVRKPPFFRWLARWSDSFTFRRATLIVTVSPYLKRRILALGIAPEKVIVLPNGVEKEAYATLASGEEVRNALGLNGCMVIGFVGWLVPWHRLDWLVTMFAGLARERRELRLLIIGEGPLKSVLADIAAKEGVTENVIFCGAVPHDRIPAHIAAMDLAVVPHTNEYRSPIKLFEYMGQGKAVVAPRLEPVEMIITDGVNGRLFPPDDEAAFRQVLEELIRNREVRNNLGARARLDVLDKYTWNRNAEAVLRQLRIED